MKQKTIFIGGGFREHQILYMIPIIDGICSRNKIKKIIFEKNFSNKLKNVNYIAKFLLKYKVEFLQNLISKENKFEKYFDFIINFTITFLKSFNISEKTLLNKKLYWLNLQFIHSIWDTCIINNKIYLNKIEILSRIKSSFFISKKIFLAEFLVKKKISHAILQHTVYTDRILFAILRDKKVKLFIQAKHIITTQKRNKDHGFKYLDKKIYNESFKFIKKKVIDKYWKDFIDGKAKYFEARVASKIKNLTKTSPKKKENVVMLHIFKDSPYENIDRERIFSDYYNWVFETLKILKFSKERWIIRAHPSSKRWGENQKKIIIQLFKKVFGNHHPKNIKFEENLRSNIDQYKNTKRLVTFSGNSHLEAACFGIKPIIISNTTLCDFGKKFYFKPKRIEHYQNLLLNGEEKKFRINTKDILQSKRIIYLIHGVINFSNDVKSYHLFRGDPKSLFSLMFKETEKATNRNYKFLNDLGHSLGYKINQSLNKKNFKLFIKKK